MPRTEWSRARALFAVTVSGATLVMACASGAKGDGGSGGSSPTTTQTASGGSGGTTTTTSSTTSGGAGGSDPVCSEDPCRLLLPQCGCPQDEMCVISGTSRVCVLAGTTGVGEACTGNACQPGALCVQNGGPPATCHKFCGGDSDCQGPGGLCALQLSDGNGGVLPDKLCSTDCDPVSSAGCPVAGNKCDLGYDSVLARFFTMCGADGSGTQGQTCTTSAECAVGHGCFTTSQNPPIKQCLHFCSYPSGVGCPVPTICAELNPVALIGGAEYGACL